MIEKDPIAALKQMDPGALQSGEGRPAVPVAVTPETRKLIPGFHLIDKSGILRAMSSNDPCHDRLHESLLPKLASLVKDGPL